MVALHVDSTVEGYPVYCSTRGIGRSPHETRRVTFLNDNEDMFGISPFFGRLNSLDDTLVTVYVFWLRGKAIDNVLISFGRSDMNICCFMCFWKSARRSARKEIPE
jgi:hypothetical protein